MPFGCNNWDKTLFQAGGPPKVLAMQKRVLIPARVRRVPRQFSWVDQRLVRERYLERCSVESWALYLFLVIVGDAQGVSFYADESVIRILSIDSVMLERARRELLEAGLIAYERPLYQVLSLQAPTLSSESRCPGGPRSVIEVLRQALGEHS